ncbi:hypothetical protein [Streptococcus sp. A22]|uniref:hypothetical protein n=1 Tax=Streptococcus sp. A22 TaxID=3373126 RepID=UPI00374CE382
MPQSIVPLGTPQSRRFEKKRQNDLLLKIRLVKVEVSFFQALTPEQLESLLEKILAYDYKTQ